MLDQISEVPSRPCVQRRAPPLYVAGLVLAGCASVGSTGSHSTTATPVGDAVRESLCAVVLGADEVDAELGTVVLELETIHGVQAHSGVDVEFIAVSGDLSAEEHRSIRVTIDGEHGRLPTAAACRWSTAPTRTFQVQVSPSGVAIRDVHIARRLLVGECASLTVRATSATDSDSDACRDSLLIQGPMSDVQETSVTLEWTVPGGAARRCACQRAASAPPSRADLTGDEQVAEAERLLSSGTSLAARVMEMLNVARQDGDVLRLTCLDDKLTQVNAHLRTLENRVASLREAVLSADASRRAHEFSVIMALGQLLSRLDHDASSCIGPL